MNLILAASALEAYLAADIPTFLWGPPGVGKSAIIHATASKQAWKVIDFRVSTRDPVALMGLPALEGDTTQWKVPDEFPQPGRDGEHGILFLDELNVAAPSMQAAAFGLVLDRRVGQYTMPPGWRVLAAGNRQSDKAAAQRMPSALANRFAHIDVDPDEGAFTAWANENDLPPLLIAFLRWRPGLLHDMSNTADLRSFPSPRAWEAVSKVLHHASPLRLSLISGIVGEGAAAELEGFIRVYQGLPSLALVLANPNSAPVPTEPAARFALAAGLARKVDPKTIENGWKYICRLPREFEIMFMVDAVRRDRALSHTQTFIDWSVKNQDVTIG